MAEYTRFEIYIPVSYVKHTSDPGTGTKHSIRRALGENLLAEFIHEATLKYHGLTQANPLSSALYKGWWRKTPRSTVQIDFLTLLFGLVRVDQSDEAMQFFCGGSSEPAFHHP